jgi:hypothetical protein
MTPIASRVVNYSHFSVHTYFSSHGSRAVTLLSVEHALGPAIHSDGVKGRNRGESYTLYTCVIGAGADRFLER